MARVTDRALSSEAAAAARQGRTPIKLNVYDLGTSAGGQLLNGLLRPLGTGAFHCGVEILGYEWSFRSVPGKEGHGVFWCRPRQCRGHTYSETLHLGYCSLSELGILWALQKLTDVWSAADYDVLTRNCIHFCDELCKQLGVRGVPSQFRNLADTSAAIVRPVCWFFGINDSEVRKEEEVANRCQLRGWFVEDVTEVVDVRSLHRHRVDWSV